MPGGREREVSDDEILRIFHETSDPVLTTMEVAEKIGFEQRGTFERLRNLVEQGKLQRKDAGSNVVWWSTEALEARYSP